ncbi:PEP-CTERM sorting domain-containing protein [Ideonella sp. BN130291]|uniref:PEP-CTERM sorting domain-containing protein n=1 Tax=Ideonella sp. BN130291 TaxID=3112940 RepID=UPI002E26E721|nr:PEP-CTERM sorting domain-containing protein [Ideonella sp. BN130291]
MKRAVVPFAIATILAAPLAHAATWQFEYSGLNDPNSSFPPIISSAKGSFTATDGNADGVISLGEVSSLQFFDRQVLPTVETWVPMGFFVSSQLSSFSYTVGTNNLLFSASAGEWGDAYTKTETTLFWTTGIGNFAYDLTAPGVQFSILDDGTSAIAAAPVPEPQTWAMALMGLAGIGVARRRLATRRAA